MKIAILSDIHDQLENLKMALHSVQHADALVCCGDLCSPFVAKALGEQFQRDIHMVFGNNDGDRFRIANVSASFPQIQIHGEYVELVFDGRKFSVNHFDNIGRALAAGGQFDVVCFGHNHQFEVTRQGKTLMVNPGEIYGGLTGKSTLVLYDTEQGEAQRIDI